MKLKRFDPNSIRVRRGGGGGFPGGGGGKVGCGGIIIVLIAALVFGADPAQMLGQMEGSQGSAPATRTAEGGSAEEVCGVNQYSMETCNALSSLNQTWEPEFRRAGITFQQPTLTFIEGGGIRTGCGAASSAMGPFYCPADQGIYIDTRFYDQLARMAGDRGDFARYYVIAHEYGHHIQNLTGLASQVRSVQAQNPRRANELQVRMELQADCYAGVWAGKNASLIERGDMEEGLRAAAAIGDDTLQSRSGRGVNPESFTHGTSRQRMEALQAGMRSGNDEICDQYFQG